MTTVTPVIAGGTPTNCITIPTLPTGLSISNTTCAITGSPANNQAATSYTIVAYNTAGYAYGYISITIGIVNYSWGTYTDNFNGTVSFTKDASYTSATNLLWMKCSFGQTYSGGTCIDPPSTIVFCGTDDASCDNGSIVTGGSMNIYTTCDSYNAGSGTFGKTTWRVPTKEELTTLLVCSSGPDTPSIPANSSGGCSAGSSTPTINQTFFPATPSSNYWTASVSSSSQAFVIGFQSATTVIVNKSQVSNLRCVSNL
jgi:hypothetical protein